jgi:hypothetical protein
LGVALQLASEPPDLLEDDRLAPAAFEAIVAALHLDEVAREQRFRLGLHPEEALSAGPFCM